MALYVHSENKSFFSNDLLSLAFIKLSNVSDHFGPPCTYILVQFTRPQLQIMCQHITS